MLTINSLAGTNWNYEFHEISNFDKQTEINRPGLSGYAEKTKPMFATLAERWSPELHAEWLQRQYVALKLIMGATLQFGSADHAYKQNLQMAVPYLSYYGMFNAVRANILTSPRSGWGRNSLTIGHERAIEKYMKEIKLFLSPEEVSKSVKLFVKAKRGRELLSYRFPSSGSLGSGGFFVYPDVAEQFARVAAELALFNSFCLGAAIEERFGTDEEWPGFKANEQQLSKLWEHVLKGTLGVGDYVQVDAEDKYRVKRMASLIRRPVPFVWMIGKGGIEDFFGAFVSSEDNETGFKPGEHWHRLLQLP